MAPHARKVSPPSVKDVASLAGVSVGTVSNVLNYPDRVSPLLVERVNKSIDQLGYVRNEAARQLRIGQSKTIGFVVPNFHDSFHEELARGIDDAAAAHGLSVLVGSSGGDPVRESNLLTLFEKYRLAGIIIAPTETAPLPLRSLTSFGTAVVALNIDGEDIGLSSVSADNVRAGELAATHVVEQGASRVVMLSSELPGRTSFKAREQGALSVFAQHRNISLELLRLNELSVNAGRDKGLELLARDPKNRPDAIIATHDLWAMGVIHSVLATPGINVPGDLLVVGCEDIDVHHLAPLALTSIRLPAYEMGMAAVESVFAAAESDSVSPKHSHLAPTLVIRTSSQAALSSGIDR